MTFQVLEPPPLPKVGRFVEQAHKVDDAELLPELVRRQSSRLDRSLLSFLLIPLIEFGDFGYF